MRGLNLGSKPAEWSTSTTTTKNVVTNFQTTTSWSTTRNTSYAKTTGWNTTRSTTTSWTTSRSTTTSFTTSQSTTTSWTTSRTTTQSTTTTFSTTKSTTTSFTTSQSTTTTFNTSKSTTTTYTTTFSTNKSTTTTFSTTKSTTTTYSTSKSTTTSWTTSKSTTTSWNTSSSTTTTYTTSWTTSITTFSTSRGTYRFSSTGWQTSWFTGGSGGFPQLCVVENQLVHYNTYQATDISQFGSGSTILEMDTPFDTDDKDELFEITSSVMDNGGGLLTGSVIVNMIYSASGGIININKYDLLITGDHPQPIFRSGSWTVERGNDIQIGDGLYHISGSQPTGSIIWVWDLEVDTTGSYKVFNISSEPHDVYFVNGFLTHNK